MYIRPAFFDNGRKERKESGVELQRGHLLSPQIKGKEKEKRNAHVSLKRRPQDKSSPNNYPVPERRKQRLKRSTPEQAAAVPRTAAAGNRPAVSAAAADTHHHPGNHSGPAESDHAAAEEDRDIHRHGLRPHDRRGGGTPRCGSRGS